MFFALTSDQRSYIQFLQATDDRYFHDLVELASVQEDRINDLTVEMATRWRMQWILGWQDLPYDGLPGFINLDRAVAGEAGSNTVLLIRTFVPEDALQRASPDVRFALRPVE